MTTASAPTTAVASNPDLTVPIAAEATGERYKDRALTCHREARAQVVGRVREVWRWDGTSSAAAAERELTAAERVALEFREAGVPAFHEVAVAEPPLLTGNLVADVCALTGLSRAALADALGVKERTVYNWQRTPPRDRATERRLRALRSIAITLYGGLGADGVQRWLQVGAPSRLERLVSGAPDAVVAEARAGLGGVSEG